MSAQICTLRSRGGVTVKVTNLGARVTELHGPDRDGQLLAERASSVPHVETRRSSLRIGHNCLATVYVRSPDLLAAGSSG